MEQRFISSRKVLKRKGNNLLVRWKGWPNKYDSWIDKKDMKNP